MKRRLLPKSSTPTPPSQRRSSVDSAGASTRGGQTPLSNTVAEIHEPSSGTQQAATVDDPGWGIDTVKVSFPVQVELCDPDSDLWTRRSTRSLAPDRPEAESLTGHLHTDSADVRVSLYPGRLVCHLEFNAARVALGDPTALLPPAALPVLVKHLIDHVHDAAWPAFYRVTDNGEVAIDTSWDEQVKIKRLDIARNFVADIDPVKAALPQVKARHGRHAVQHKSREGGWTLENKTAKVGSDRLYDKGAELSTGGDRTFLHHNQGLLRFETQLQADRLDGCGLTRLSNVSEGRCWAALDHRWEQTRWGTPIAAPGEVMKAIRPLSVDKGQRLLGFLHQAAVGATGHMSAPQLRRMRDLARSVGLTPGLPVEMLGPADRYLDLGSGSLRKCDPSPPVL